MVSQSSNFRVEYLQLLQKHIKRGKPVSKDQMRYIDTCEFWKDRYTEMYLEKKNMEDKLHCLEEVNRLRSGSPQNNDEEDSSGFIHIRLAQVVEEKNMDEEMTLR